MRAITFFLTFLFVFRTYALDETYLLPQKGNDLAVVSIFPEDNKWYVAEFKIEPGDFQEKVSEEIFETENEARNFFKNKYKNLIRKNPKSIQSLIDKNTQVSFDRTRKVWETKNLWSLDWEKKYADWILNNFNNDFYVLHQIQTDCADVAISARWIFARINGLPIGQTLAGSGSLFTNESFRRAWNNLSTAQNWYEDQLFRTVLEYVMQNTYTHSLIKDSYPIKITRETMLPGTHHLNLHSVNTGHTMLFTNYSQSGGVIVSYSDMPRIIRRLYSRNFFEYSQPAPERGGFLKIRWLVKDESGKWKLEEKEKLPLYSTEQYDPSFIRPGNSYFHQEVNSRISLSSSAMTELKEQLENLRLAFNARVNIVKNGFEYCSQNDCSEGTSAYEEHSTPNRDRRVLDLIIFIEDHIKKNEVAFPEMPGIYESFLSENFVVIDSDEAIYFTFLVTVWKEGLYSSQPSDSIRKRWGI